MGFLLRRASWRFLEVQRHKCPYWEQTTWSWKDQQFFRKEKKWKSATRRWVLKNGTNCLCLPFKPGLRRLFFPDVERGCHDAQLIRLVMLWIVRIVEKEIRKIEEWIQGLYSLVISRTIWSWFMKNWFSDENKNDNIWGGVGRAKYINWIIILMSNW